MQPRTLASLSTLCALAPGLLGAIPLRIDLQGYGGVDQASLSLPNPALPAASVQGINFGVGATAEAFPMGPMVFMAGMGFMGFAQEATLRQEQFGEKVEGDFSASLFGIDGTLGVGYRPLAKLRLGVHGFAGVGLGGGVRAKIGVLDTHETIASMTRFGASAAAGYELRWGLSPFVEVGWYSSQMTLKSSGNAALLADPSGQATALRATAFSYRAGIQFRVVSWGWVRPSEPLPPKSKKVMPRPKNP